MNKTIIKITMSALTVVLAFVAFTANASAATFVVNTTLDTQDAIAGNGFCADAATGACSLRAAITEANALALPDIITLPAGTYTETILAVSENANASGDFDITSDITINGAGAGTTFVEANLAAGAATERVFHIRGAAGTTILTVFINGLTVRNGRYTTAAGTFGAGIRIDQGIINATLNDVTVTNNQDGTSGGGIAVSGTSASSILTINNSTISNNTAGGTTASSSTGAGILLNTVGATVNINNSTISGNTVSNTSTTVSASGGGISSVGTLNITNSVVSGNTATSSGLNSFSGGIHVTNGTTTLTGSTVSGNASTVTAGTGAGLAGGIYNQQATVNINSSTVTGNTASSFHAGVRTLSSGTFAATTNITNSTVSNNSTPGEGGGVINISGGSAAAITNITLSTINGNTATAATSVGGGIENFNSSTGAATVNLINSTVAENSAGSGGGIYNNGSLATINLDFSTVASNTATTNGGGLFQGTTAGGATNLRNSIVADNTAPTGPDIFGTITSQGYNHVEDTAGGTFATSTGDVTGSDPILGPLTFHGGTTRNYLPGVLSPVNNTIPTGVNGCGTTVTTAQNAVTRPQETACEKGSTERLLTPTAASVSIDGRVLTNSGLPISGAAVMITDSSGNVFTMRTNRLGVYRFTEMAAGETYIISAAHKRYVFATRVVNVTEDLNELDFKALTAGRSGGM